MVVWIILNSCNSKMFNSLLHSDLISLLDKAKLPQLTITLVAFHQDQVSPACPPDRLLVVPLFNNSLLTSCQALQDSRQISNLKHNSLIIFSRNSKTTSNNNKPASSHSNNVSSHSNSKHVSSNS